MYSYSTYWPISISMELYEDDAARDGGGGEEEVGNELGDCLMRKSYASADGGKLRANLPHGSAVGG